MIYEDPKDNNHHDDYLKKKIDSNLYTGSF